MRLLDSFKTTVRSWLGTGPYIGQSLPYELFGNADSIPFAGPASALNYTPVYRAVTLISNDIARTSASFGSSKLSKVWDRPNKWQSGYDFRRQMTLQALLYGNSFALINRKRNGDIFEIVPLPIGSVQLDVSDAVPLYKTTDYGLVDPDNILHLKASPLEGLWANSPINLCKTAIVIGMNQENNVVQNAQSGGLPNMAFVHAGTLPIQARQAIVNDYIKNHTGKNTGKPIVLSDNIKIEKLTSTSVAADLEQARKYSIADVSRIYGVPTSYLSETGGSVYGSMEWLSRMYLDACLSHWYEAWKAEFMLKLGEEPMFDTDFIVKPSIAETFAALRTGVEASIITRNEARAYLDFDAVDGGDDFIVAKNMGEGGGSTNIGTDTSQGTAKGDITSGNPQIT